jgi:hypothetical protein
MTQAISKANSPAVGTVVSIGGVTGAGGTTFTPVGGIHDAKFSGIKVPTTDVSTFALLAKRKMGTLPDFGTFTFTTLRETNDAGQIAMTAAAASAASYDFKVQLPIDTAIGQTTTGDLIVFSAIVTEAGGFDISLTKQADVSYTIEIDGAWTITAGA